MTTTRMITLAHVYHTSASAMLAIQQMRIDGEIPRDKRALVAASTAGDYEGYAIKVEI